MQLQLTMDEVQILAVILSLLCFVPLGKWLIIYNVKYILKHKSPEIGNLKCWSYIVAVVLINLPMFALITSITARIILAAGEVLTYWLMATLTKKDISSLEKETALTSEDTNYECKKLIKYFKLSQGLLSLTGGAVLYLACFPLLLWLFPDVAYISKEGSTFYTKLRFEIPYTQGFSPGGSYIVNETPDTLLRVIVKYAFPEKDKCNVYGVVDKYPPFETTKMVSKANYIMRPIPLYMQPQVSRSGKYPRKEIFIVDKEQLWDFQVAKMRNYGLKRNREVCKDSISEPRNRTIINTKIREMPSTDKSSFYIYHYDGC
ncbi:MAG: hypothetical protein NC548_43740 [Lachnospiraceae bacterium]|nr:hypothetical protein [Lachnospiraceae bacterium]